MVPSSLPGNAEDAFLQTISLLRQRLVMSVQERSGTRFLVVLGPEDNRLFSSHSLPLVQKVRWTYRLGSFHKVLRCESPSVSVCTAIPSTDRATSMEAHASLHQDGGTRNRQRHPIAARRLPYR